MLPYLVSFILMCLIPLGVQSFDQHFVNVLLSPHSPTLKRFQRSVSGDGGNRAVTFMPCCSFEVDKELSLDFLKQFHDAKEQCVEELFGGNSTRNRRFGGFICVVECIGKKFNFVDEDGNLDEEGVRDFFLNEMPISDEIRPIAEETVTKCIAKTNQYPKDNELTTLTRNEIFGTFCNKASARLFFCVLDELMKSCPSESQDKSKTCERIRHENFRRYVPRRVLSRLQ